MSFIGHFADIARKMQAVTPAGRATPSQPELMETQHSNILLRAGAEPLWGLNAVSGIRQAE